MFDLITSLSVQTFKHPYSECLMFAGKRKKEPKKEKGLAAAPFANR